MSGGTPEHPPLARKNFFGGARVVQRPPRGQPQLSKMGVPGPAPAANHRRRCPGTGFVEWDDLPCQVCPPIGLTCRVTSGLANASPVVSWRRPSVRATCQVCPSTRLHLGHRLPKFFFFFFFPSLYTCNVVLSTPKSLPEFHFLNIFFDFLYRNRHKNVNNKS